jgi:radical SAM superfamily enzyme YgiQ (UPF0313 family)
MFNILMPYPQTELYEEGIKSGVLKADVWRDFASNPRKDFSPLFWHEWFTKRELRYFLNSAYRSFYLRPRFIWSMLSQSWNIKIFIKRIRAGLEMLSLPTKND